MISVVKYVQLPLSAAVPSSQTPPVWNSYAFEYADDADGGYGEVDSVRTPTGSLFQYRYLIEGGVREAGGNCGRQCCSRAEGHSRWDHGSGLDLQRRRHYESRRQCDAILGRTTQVVIWIPEYWEISKRQSCTALMNQTVPFENVYGRKMSSLEW